MRFTGRGEHMSRPALEFGIHDFTALSQSAVRQLVDQLVTGASPDVAVSDLSAARWLRAYAIAVGARAEIITDTSVAAASPR